MEVKFCGFHTHNVNRDVIYRPSWQSGYLFVLVLAPMYFEYEDSTGEMAQPGGCILYKPGAYQHYYAEEIFFNSFVEFTYDTKIEEGYSIPCNRVFYPKQYEILNQQLRKIHQEYLSKGMFGEEMIELYLRQLIVMLGRSFQGTQAEYIDHEVYQEFYESRFLMLTQCQQVWTTERLCSLVKFERSRFYQLYQQYFNSTPKEDLIQARLQLALYHMTNHSNTIQTAAYQAGFQNINHFNRLFKCRLGCTPGAYRKRSD